MEWVSLTICAEIPESPTFWKPNGVAPLTVVLLPACRAANRGTAASNGVADTRASRGSRDRSDMIDGEEEDVDEANMVRG